MRPTRTHLIALMLAALALASCARRSDVPVSSLGEDDDAICRANGVVVGSADYAACRKNRDVQRSNSIQRADRAQRNLGEYMLNNPGRP
jgi:hypothetical protein